MIAFSFSQLTQMISGQIINLTSELTEKEFRQVTIDSRKVEPQGIFIAIKGEHFDGHDFAQQAKDQGAALIIVQYPLSVNIPQIVVADSRQALGQIAKWVRQRAKAKVVALTGSSGKTSVKEMTAVILGQCGVVLYTEGNFNNDIGVPLTLLRLTEEHQFAVIELGANHAGEIAYTVQLVLPENVLITNIAAAHLAGFGSIQGVLAAKSEIFTSLTNWTGTIIINRDNEFIMQWQSSLVAHNVWQFSLNSPQADFYATDIKIAPTGTQFVLHSPLGESAVELSLLGQHNVANALAASALAISVGATLSAVQKGLAQCKPVPGRLFPIQIAPGKLLLDDTYNANVGSMTAAAQVLSQMPGHKVMVVGDMGELGEQSVECHQQVGQAIKDYQIDQVISVGNLSRYISQISNGLHLTNKSEVVVLLDTLLSQHNEITILIKGSRRAAMEEIIHQLRENRSC